MLSNAYAPMQRSQTLPASRVQDGKAGEFVFLKYGETAERVAWIASCLANLGLSRQDRVGVYGANCPEWMIAMQVGARGRKASGRWGEGCRGGAAGAAGAEAQATRRTGGL